MFYACYTLYNISVEFNLIESKNFKFWREFYLLSLLFGEEIQEVKNFQTLFALVLN